MKKKILSAVLAAVFCMSALTGCGGSEESSSQSGSVSNTGGENTSEELSMTIIDIPYNPSGRYTGEISFEGLFSGSIRDVKSEDFTLEAHKGGEGEGTALSGFTVSKTGDRTLSYDFFAQPFNETGNLVTLLSKASVTSDGRQIGAFMTISEPHVEIGGLGKGAYSGSDEMTVEVKMLGDGVFANDLSADMFSLPEGAAANVSVVRKDDETALLTIRGISEDLFADSIDILIAGRAINVYNSEDVTLSVPFAKPSVMLEGVSLDSLERILSVEKIILPASVSGKELGLSLISGSASIIEQSYNAGENYYSVKIELPEATEAAAAAVRLGAAMLFYEDSIVYEFSPVLPAVSIEPVVSCDENINSIRIALKARNGVFAEDVSKEDFVITGADDLELTLVLSSAEEVVFEIRFEEGAKISRAVGFYLPAGKMGGAAPQNGYGASVVIQNDGGRFGVADIITLIGPSLADTVFDMAIMPAVCNIFGIDTTNPDMEEIKAKLRDVEGAISALSKDITSLKTSLRDSEYRSFVENTFAPLETKLNTLMISLGDKNDVIAHIAAVKNNTATEESAGAFAAAVKKSMETLYTMDWITNIMTYGDCLIRGQRATDVTTGVLQKYFELIDSLYNFESQTVTTKKAFLTNVQNTYTVSAGYAVEYLKATGENALAAELVKQANAVNAEFKKYWDKIAAAEKNAGSGRDALLVRQSKPAVSRDLINDRVYGTFMNSPLGVSTEELCAMINRASARGMSLADDLKSAGFKNVNPDSGSRYVYFAQASATIETRMKKGVSWIEMTKHPERALETVMHYKGDVVIQAGNGGAEIQRNVDRSAVMLTGADPSTPYKCGISFKQ